MSGRRCDGCSRPRRRCTRWRPSHCDWQRSRGARRSELAALRWTELDGSILTVDSALVAVREGKGETLTTELRDQPTKTGDRRRMNLDPETLALIEPQQAKRQVMTKRMFSDTERPPHPDRVGYRWQRARTLAEVDTRRRLHDLRDWSATAALGDGFDLATVAQRLGHSDPSVTLPGVLARPRRPRRRGCRQPQPPAVRGVNERGRGCDLRSGPKPGLSRD